MTSLRVQLAVPAALAGTAFGILVLTSLRTQLAIGLRQSADRHAVIVRSALTSTRSLESLSPTGIVVVAFRRDGSQVILAPPNGNLATLSIDAETDVVPPEGFLSETFVGRVVPVDSIPGAPGLGPGDRLAILVPTRQAVLTYAEVRVRLILSVLAGVFLLVAVAFAMASFLVGRVRRLTEAAGALDSEEPLPVALMSQADELGRLGRALEQTRATLYTNKTKISRLQKMRSEFLANVSHEIRTPLFSLKGFLETLLDGGLEDPSVNRAFLEKAQNQAQRLDILLRDLIEISRIESGDMRLSFRYFPVGPFLRQVVSDHSELAARKGHHLELTAPEADALGDKERLRQVFDNLLANAITYCPSGSNIRVSAAVGERGILLKVQDDGPGIAAEHLPRLFERFYRVNPDRSREQGGTGLGLAIVKHIVEAHGAIIHVESILGRGTSFSFELPH